MAIPSRQIGWGTEENLLWQISKQLEQLTGVTSKITIGGGGGSYLSYVAVLKQQDTNDPIAIVLENTLPEVPVWSRDSTGYYRLSAVNEIFKTNKTVSFIGSNYDSPLGTMKFGRADNNGSDTERVIWLNVYNTLFEPADISAGGSSFYDVYVEIRVYP